MSKMSELSIDIEEMLVDGHDPKTVAQVLDIPLEWVLITDTYINGDIEECDDAIF